MRLSHLLPSSSADTVTGSRDPEVTGLTADSRAVKPGFVFAALAGAKADGRAYIADALAKGAAAILAAEGTELPAGSLDGSGAVLVTAAQPRLTFARMAASFHGRQPDTVIAVTGTNGKTSTVQFAAQIWERLGLKAASLGTLGLIGPGLDGYGGMTTPDPVTLHKDLAAVASAGIDHLAMEASSHGLEQFRLDGVALKAAGFTNLTRDHLDYHGSMEAYRDAKAMLFGRVLPPGAAAVLNADSYDFQHFAAICTQRGHRLLSYGLAGTELRVNGVEPLAHGQRLALTVLGRDVTVDLPLAGRFQAWNVLCALGLVIGAGADTDAHIDGAVAALSSLEGVPGRLQHVATHPNGAAVYVDFAHTPDALETVLTALRSHAGRHLVTVFGCGGDRDRGKRPVMGELAARLADRAIVTDDNPRTEDPAVVRGEVLAGGRAKLEEVGDRAEAIRVAVRGLQPGDVLVIAGKGHEQGQTIGTEIRPFDDADEARKAVVEVGS